MTLVVADDRLLARPVAGDRTALAALGEPHRGQPQHDLQRHVLAPAERPADRRVDHPHPIPGQVEGVGDLLLVLVDPLAGDLDRDPALAVDVADGRLRLEVGVFLVGQLVGGFDDRCGARPGVVDRALADLVGVVDVAAEPELGVHQGGVGGERLVDVGDDRQLLPVGLDRGCRSRGLGHGLGHDERQVVGLPAADVALDPGAPGVFDRHEHRLIELGQPVLVDRHVAPGEHGHDAGHLFGLRGVEPDQPGVRLIGEHDPGDERVGRGPVARVLGGAGHLGMGVDPDRRGADGHDPPAT